MPREKKGDQKRITDSTDRNRTQKSENHRLAKDNKKLHSIIIVNKLLG